MALPDAPLKADTWRSGNEKGVAKRSWPLRTHESPLHKGIQKEKGRGVRKSMKGGGKRKESLGLRTVPRSQNAHSSGSPRVAQRCRRLLRTLLWATERRVSHSAQTAEAGVSVAAGLEATGGAVTRSKTGKTYSEYTRSATGQCPQRLRPLPPAQSSLHKVCPTAAHPFAVGWRWNARNGTSRVI